MRNHATAPSADPGSDAELDEFARQVGKKENVKDADDLRRKLDRAK